MHIDVMMSLRPADGSAAAIRASIDRARARRSEVEADLSAAEAQRGSLLVNGTKKQIETNEARITEAAASLAQLDAFTEALADPLIAAEKAEKEQKLRAEYDSIGADAAIAEFVEAWRGTYEMHARAIAALCEMERAAIEKVRQAQRVKTRMESYGMQVDLLPTPMVAAFGGGARGFSSIGDMIRLPGILGAPNVPISTDVKYSMETVRKPDFDAPGATDVQGNVLKYKWVEERREDRTITFQRDDTEIWWPRTSAK